MIDLQCVVHYQWIENKSYLKDKSTSNIYLPLDGYRPQSWNKDKK